MNDTNDTPGENNKGFDWGLTPEVPTSGSSEDSLPTAEDIEPTTSDHAESQPTAPIDAGDDLSHWTAPTPRLTDAENDEVPRVAAGAAGFDALAQPGETDSKKMTPKLWWWISGGLVALAVVIGLFFFGSRIGDLIAGGAATPTPTPTPTPEATAPLPVGKHPWNTLFGGECLSPFKDAWEETYTVVDCAEPHAAQLVYRGDFGGDETTVFPGETELANQINGLCTRPGVIDSATATAYPDLQMQGSFPVTKKQWTEDKRYYYCFVNRSSGDLINESLQGSGPQ